MSKAYILLGANLGNPVKNLEMATQYIHQFIGSVERVSSLYQTAAWGHTAQPDFVNQVIIVQTDLSPLQTLQACLEIERKMGRIRTIKNAARNIDIDILFFNKDILQSEALCLPHPAMQYRRFVLVPLHELSPLFKHPILHKTIHQLLKECEDTLDVKKI
ncbi:MAG: 2-amino-4-hydroxy-6-hydroxymethyldihydropteridine diphosphokinase [Niastella sp. SCN 39-18]|nr:2-amino-4-hydroxy-6-hydroxymethyldihydropteridine diphosphokinase [Sphingobacteriales bacterium]ODT51803.1 MAG: 2-amino-4-hydroxy-6-hydroxymethyldihydropteridine diphosphokinase [Niastella sp. SCN 39-18]OJW10104.1 MAG: 2-amino-4-hydroxy-6-hydroxymethyldihydropteridine diphosphokinase [Sphingobacteriales bacterium 39-19]